MSDQLPDDLLLVPEPGNTFLDMWRNLSLVERLYIPAATAETYGVADSMGSYSIEGQSALYALDHLIWPSSSGELYGAVYSDRRIVRDDIVCMSVETSQALERYFHNSRVAGVRFNSSMGQESLPGSGKGDYEAAPITFKTSFSGTIKRFILPRLIGFLRSSDPLASGESTHAQIAERYLAQDQVYQAVHHSALAREDGAEVDDYFFTELLALDTVGLQEDAYRYLGWYLAQYESCARIELIQARLAARYGNSESVFEMVAPYLEDEQHRGAAYLEQGRAHVINHRYQDAIESFSKSLEYWPNHHDTLLGRAIALRGMHYQSGDQAGLMEALKDFGAVCAMDGYHKPEALHHSGTVHLRLADYEQAEKFFLEALMLRESAVTRHNLILIYATQARIEEAQEQLEILRPNNPEMAAEMEQVIVQASQQAQGGSQQQLREVEVVLPNHKQMEEIGALALSATERLRNWGVPINNDILDFRRVDYWFDHWAPAGYFVENSVFYDLSKEEMIDILAAIAMHLGGILVRRGHGRWVLSQDGAPIPANVQMNDREVFPAPLNMFNNIARRLQVGASADNLTNLDMLVSLLPEYDKLSKFFENPIKVEDASEAAIREYAKVAEQAKEMAKQLGVELAEHLSDLKKLDELFDQIFMSGGYLQQEEHLHEIIGENCRQFAIGLGIHFGFIVQRYTEGTWTAHPSIEGVAIRDTLIRTMYPVQMMLERIRMGNEANMLNNLQSYISPLVCAELARKVQRHEVDTQDQLASLLADALPSIMKDDPSGGSLERMVQLIFAQASM